MAAVGLWIRGWSAGTIHKDEELTTTGPYAFARNPLYVGSFLIAPVSLDSPGKRALYNNLDQNEELALKIDKTVRAVRPDGFRGIQTRENVIKAAMLPLLDNDVDEVERVFLIIKAQSEY